MVLPMCIPANYTHAMTSNLKERAGRGAIAKGRPTPTVENYLKAIMKQGGSDGAISTQELAQYLEVSGATVTAMLKHLAREGWAAYTPYHGVRLTARGQTEALRVIRRHRLLEKFLTDVVGVPWDEVDAEAEALEHALSERLEKRIDALLAHPRIDPHGDPIPARHSRQARVVPRLPKLTETAAGRRVIVRGVSDSNPARLRNLATYGIKPGTQIEVVGAQDGESLSVRIGGRKLTLARSDAEAVFVAPARKKATTSK